MKAYTQMTKEELTAELAEQRARLASKEKPEEVKELGEEVPRLQQEYKNPFIKKTK